MASLIVQIICPDCLDGLVGVDGHGYRYLCESCAGLTVVFTSKQFIYQRR